MGFVGYCKKCKERVKVSGNNAPFAPSSTAFVYQGRCPKCNTAISEMKPVPKFGGKWRA